MSSKTILHKGDGKPALNSNVKNKVFLKGIFVMNSNVTID